MPDAVNRSKLNYTSPVPLSNSILLNNEITIHIQMLVLPGCTARGISAAFLERSEMPEPVSFRVHVSDEISAVLGTSSVSIKAEIARAYP